MGFFARERTIAPAGYNRWLVPPAALSIHLCIGQAYAFSVFNGPLTKAIGITAPAPGDWTLPELGWIFSLAIVFLGLSAAFGGRWVEAGGPRRAMFLSACCFGGGFLVAALGIQTHMLWLVYLGYGVIGGIGLGIGYISPVSTLIKWFPDRPGMATGLAIMGFGGGALIGSPLAVELMAAFSSPTSNGVAQTFVAMGLIYFVVMMFGMLIVRVPSADWKPAGYVPPAQTKKMVSRADVHVDVAFRTSQFWLLWAVLCLNVTAGIGVLGQASVMSQEMFPGVITPIAAAGFVGLLSLFNMAGRFLWSSASDVIGRKGTYAIYFVLGIALYATVPWAGQIGSVGLFVACYAVILSMYGGGFATIPAYLRDMFGTMHVGAIHGRLLTAWSAAGILGPVLVNYISAYQKSRGIPPSAAYSETMYIMAGLLVIGFICNALVRPVDARHHHRPETGPAPAPAE
ncbi:OFA family MFS transporter [Inquilinus limosus]|uniref:MFS transporter n=1 Tax=Inquilinus limosus TaxID=171674 RepID=A0A211ZQQ5_9PROT|nr:OFA family MFS transporter [Inquilinus limosus]OWJ67595.1 MFS transporter [Inquilinus limosus]